MISKIFRLLLLLWIGFGFTAHADEPAYVVFYNSGKATKLVLGKAVVLKKGDQLYKTDRISIPAQTQLALICSNYAVIQLKTPLNKLVNDLPACNKQNISASSAYFKYVWNAFAHKHVSPDKDPRAYMQTYGAVSRGNHFAKLAIDTIYYHQGPLKLYWKQGRMAEVEIYKVAQDGQLISKGKAANYGPIDSLAKGLKRPGTYYWDLAGEQSAKRKVLLLINTATYEKLKDRVLANVVVTTPAETAYLKAFLFEERHLLAEAAYYYQLATQLAPTNEAYALSYAKFKP